jgi:peptide/nickel transport system ATP-binding protein
VPDPDIKQTRVILEGSIPSATDLPAGCPFATRCPRRVGAICDDSPPPEQTTASGHRIACHFPLADLMKVGPVVRRVVE